MPPPTAARPVRAARPAALPPALIFAAGELSADMLYATGLFTPDPFLWCRVGDDRLVIVNPLEYGRACAQVPAGTTVLSFAEAKKRFRLRQLTAHSLVAGISRAYGVKRWDVPGDFPLALAQHLQRAGLTLRAHPGSLFPARQCKSDAEIAHLTAGVRLAEAGMERAFTILRAAVIDGDTLRWHGAALTVEILRGEVDAEIARQGGVASHTIVAPGVQGADPHEGGHGPIAPHQPLVLDIFPRVTHTGYWGDLTRTVVKGQASDVVQRAFAAVLDARDTAKTKIKAGANGRKAHEAAMARLVAAGFKTDADAKPPYGFFHGTGHGLGLEIHEAPRLSRVDHQLAAGMVVTVEPGLYYPAWGGIRLEDVVVVEKRGCRTLTAIPTFLEIP